MAKRFPLHIFQQIGSKTDFFCLGRTRFPPRRLQPVLRSAQRSKAAEHEVFSGWAPLDWNRALSRVINSLYTESESLNVLYVYCENRCYFRQSSETYNSLINWQLRRPPGVAGHRHRRRGGPRLSCLPAGPCQETSKGGI